MSDNETAADIVRNLPAIAEDRIKLRAGSVVRIVELVEGWSLIQKPEVQAAFVATNTHDGSIRALVGGFDFDQSEYNRAFQGCRQPGSIFKVRLPTAR